jgi:hypothetical protein
MPRKSKSAVLVVSPDNSTPVLPPAAAWQPTTWRAEDIAVHTLLGVGGQASVYLAEKDGSQFAFKYAVVSLPQTFSGGVGPALQRWQYSSGEAVPQGGGGQPFLRN